MQRIKVLLQPKILRLLALGMVLVASLLLLIQYNYGAQYLVAMGRISTDPKTRSADVEVLATFPANGPKSIEVSASKLLLGNIEKRGPEKEVLAVIYQRGDKLFFERIYTLTEPEGIGLHGPNFGPEKQLTLAVGRKPELVAMIGLDRYGYDLAQPIWAKQKMPGADLVYQQTGIMDAARDILDGTNIDFVPDVFVLDSQTRIVGLRRIDGRLVTFPEFLRIAAVVLYCLAVLAGLGSLLIYKRSAIANAGKRIWDHVSIRGRRAST